MKKIFNFRLLVAIALSVLCGVVICYYSPALKNFALILLVIIYAVVFALSGIFFKEVTWLKRLVVCSVCLFFALCGYGRFYITVLQTENGAMPSMDYTVSGTVDSVSEANGKTHIKLIDCKYDGKSGGNLYLYDLSGSVEKGDKIEVECYAHRAQFIDGNKYFYYVGENISMVASDAVLLKNSGQSAGIFNFIRGKLKDLIYTDDDTSSAIALALFIGDTSKLSYEELSTFRMSGIAHVFAVSGMHVGLLYFALNFIFKRLKIKRMIAFAVTAVVLLLYVGVCGFSASSLRAGIMCIMAAFGNTIGEKNDRLNNLAISAIIVSLVNVGDVVGVGFILSFTVCLFIIILAPTIKRALSFLGDKFSSALSVLFAAELASLPICIVYFGYFPIVAIFTNLLLIPVITFCYYLIWIGVLLGILLPFQSLGLTAAKLMITGVYTIVDGLAESKAFITEFATVYLIAYYPFLVLSGDAVNCKKVTKISSFAIVLSEITVSAVVSLIF